MSSFAYGHDSVGNRTAMTEVNGDVTSYVYDNVYRLMSEEKRDSGDALLYRYQYTYDGVGNRLTMNNAGLVTYTYDANNKLTQLVGPSGTTTFAYDNNGNTTQMATPGGTWSYGYDYENRLVSVAGPGNYSAAYGYTPDGLRIRAQESNHAQPDRWFQLDGVRPVLEGTLSGDTWTTQNIYAWEGSSYYDPLVYANFAGPWRHFLYDGLGSTRQLIDSNQAVTDTYSYEAFGNSMGSTGSTPNPYRYVGSLGYYRDGSGLMKLGLRYYMSYTGRFTQQDPLVASGQWPLGPPLVSVYTYADNAPTVYVDASGEWVHIVIGGLALLLAGGCAAGKRAAQKAHPTDWWRAEGLEACKDLYDNPTVCPDKNRENWNGVCQSCCDEIALNYHLRFGWLEDCYQNCDAGEKPTPWRGP